MRHQLAQMPKCVAGASSRRLYDTSEKRGCAPAIPAYSFDWLSLSGHEAKEDGLIRGGTQQDAQKEVIVSSLDSPPSSLGYSPVTLMQHAVLVRSAARSHCLVRHCA